MARSAWLRDLHLILAGGLALGASAWAQDRKATYHAECFVVNHRADDTVVFHHDTSFSTTDDTLARGGIKKDFTVPDYKNKLTLALAYKPEDDLFYLGLRETAKKLEAQTTNRIPDRLYVFLGTPDYGLIAECHLSPQ